MKKISSKATVLVIALMISVPCTAATHKQQISLDRYVTPEGHDSNDGSAKHPWATITHADKMVGPGAVVHVAPGVYRQNVTTSSSGNPSAPITFVSDTRWGARIVGTEDSIWLGYGSYVNIVNFDVSAANNTPRMGIYINGGTHNKIVGNRVHDIVATKGGSNGGAGIEAGPGSHYSEISNNLIFNIGVGTGNVKHTHGIYISRSQHQLVSNNIVMNVVGWAVHLYHQPVGYVRIVNNTLVDNGGGIVVASDGSGALATDYNEVVNNLIAYNRFEFGIRECCSPSNVGSHNSYSHNLLYHNLPSDYSFFSATARESLVADPRFVNASGVGNRDYHLAPQSPALRIANCAQAPATDFDGVARHSDRGCDVGAYQHNMP